MIRAPGSVLTIVLGIGLAAQVTLLCETYVLPIAERIWPVRDQTALDRSAEIAFGNEFASYIRYLRETIPEGGRVVLPPMIAEPVYGNVGLMQYFLFPREVVNCPPAPAVSECVRSMHGPRSYILAIGDFPHPSDVPAGKTLMTLADGYGLYVPPR